MALKRKLLMRLFGRPQGFLGRLGGPIMARMNREAGEQVVDLPLPVGCGLDPSHRHGTGFATAGGLATKP
jgi:hypothetical protein